MQKRLALICLVMCIALPVHASNGAGVNASSPNKLYVAFTGEVTITFLSSETTHADSLFLTGSSAGTLLNNTSTAGTTYSLGSFQAGTELVFGLLVSDTGYRFYTGPSSPNPDKTHHVSLTSDAGGKIIVGFEDTYDGGDRDYNDFVFSVSNVRTPGISPVPEPETWALVLVGLLLMGVAQRCRDGK